MWKDLSMGEKAALINIGVKNGFYDLEDIKKRLESSGIVRPLLKTKTVEELFLNANEK